MEYINRTAYFIFATFTFGLAVNAFFDFKNQKINDSIKKYWALAAILIFISSITYAIGSWGIAIALIVGNNALIASLIILGILFRSLYRQINKNALYLISFLYLIFACLISSLIIFQAPYFYRFYLVALALVVVTIWQILEIYQLKKYDSSIHIQFIFYLLIFVLIVLISRMVTAVDVSSLTIKYLYQESSLGVLARIILLSGYLLLFVFMANYFYDKLLLEERETLNQLKDKLINLDLATTENEEIKRLLTERNALIDSLLKTNKTSVTGALSASIGHELNQPLGAILLNVQFLKSLVNSDRIDLKLENEILNSLEGDTKRAGNIIQSLRSIFIEDKINREFVMISEIVRSVLTIVQSELKNQHIELDVLVEPVLGVLVNKSQIHQVLLNLINNAIQSLAPLNMDIKRISIRAFEKVSSVILIVADNGLGVPENQQDHLFELLSSDKPTGMGLGLWLCSHIVTQHGGKIHYEKTLDGGAQFVIELVKA